MPGGDNPCSDIIGGGYAKMSRRAAHWLAALTAAVMGVAAVSPAAAPAAPDPGGSESQHLPVPAPGKAFGFNDHAWMSSDEFGRLVTAQEEVEWARGAGANWHRVDLGWRAVEPSRDRLNGAYLDSVEDFVDRWQRTGHILMILGVAAPDWAALCRDCGLAGPKRSEVDEWGEHVRQMALRFPHVEAFEIWNEPNLFWFWQPAPDARVYAEYAKRAFREIKRVRPRAKVIVGALSNASRDSATTQTMGSYLNALYANGIKGHYDALSFHAYPSQSNHAFEGLGAGTYFAWSFADIRAARDAHDPAARLWITESGITTTGGDPNCGKPAMPKCMRSWEETSVPPTTQADALERIYDRVLSMPDVDGLFIHGLFESERWPASSRETGFGIADARPNGWPNFRPMPKPAYCRFHTRAGADGTVIGCP